MARMHTRKKGKSRSHKDRYTSKPTWIKTSNEEITDNIVQLKNSNLTASEIGIRLRDQYAIPSTKLVLGKKLNTVLEEKSLKPVIPDDLQSLITRYKKVSAHLALNTRDKSNNRGRTLVMAKILRLIKYYRRNNVLPAGWNLDKVL
jgi:small subunit ribosomal protein S15